MREFRKEDASFMADNDDKREDGSGHKKTLTLKGAPGMGGRPGMSRSSRSTVVVEKRTRVVAPRSGAPGATAPRPHPTQSATPPAQRPQLRQPSPPPGRPNGGLSTTESEARARVLREASARQAEERDRFNADEARRIEEERRRR